MTPAQRSRFVFAMVTLLALAALAAAAHWRYPVDRAALPERSTGYRINVNSAEQDELCLLPRVGPSLANYIIERRQTVGPFTAVDQLDQVRFIGGKTLARMRDFVTVGNRGAKFGQGNRMSFPAPSPSRERVNRGD